MKKILFLTFIIFIISSCSFTPSAQEITETISDDELICYIALAELIKSNQNFYLAFYHDKFTAENPAIQYKTITNENGGGSYLKINTDYGECYEVESVLFEDFAYFRQELFKSYRSETADTLLSDFNGLGVSFFEENGMFLRTAKTVGSKPVNVFNYPYYFIITEVSEDICRFDFYYIDYVNESDCFQWKKQNSSMKKEGDDWKLDEMLPF